MRGFGIKLVAVKMPTRSSFIPHSLLSWVKNLKRIFCLRHGAILNIIQALTSAA
jgi:hypothetical protein